MLQKILLTLIPSLLAVALFLLFPVHSGPELGVVSHWALPISQRDGNLLAQGELVALSNNFGHAIVATEGGIAAWDGLADFHGASQQWAVNYSVGSSRPQLLSLVNGRSERLPEPYLPWPVAGWVLGLLPDRSGLVLSDNDALPLVSREFRWVSPLTVLAGNAEILVAGLVDGRVQAFYPESSASAIGRLSSGGDGEQLRVFHQEWEYLNDFSRTLAERVVSGLAVSDSHIAVLFGATKQRLVLTSHAFELFLDYPLSSLGLGRVSDLRIMELDQGYLLLRLEREEGSLWLRVAPNGEVEELSGPRSVFSTAPGQLPALGLGFELVRDQAAAFLRFYRTASPEEDLFWTVMRPGDLELRDSSVFWLADAAVGQFSFEWVE